MSKVIYIEASPLKSRSHTIAVARAFLDAYRLHHPDDQIEQVDLWTTQLPPFDGVTIDAKFAVLRRKEFTAEQMARWEAVRAVSRRFNSADKYVFGVPMWNFGVPYPLKHYIDVVTLPGENWTWSKANGYGTILSGKKALLICASANLHSASGEGASDFQKPYLRRWLRFIGVNDLREITVAPTLADPDAVAASRAVAIQAAEGLAPAF
ncbi:MAG TPA: NAD(P)H-dependent oxidoreductase [Steroidobacteraceae bacterium]|nr:NAD(P)H-dependent oxidoreductase [Steroidobacteraceae bacterium]